MVGPGISSSRDACVPACMHPGDKVKSWKKRFFVLRHDMIQLRFEYYKQPGSDMLGAP